MKLTIQLTDPRALDLARDYARRRGVRLATAVARLLVSGALRLDALQRYARSARGRRTRRLYAERRALRASTARRRARRSAP